MNIELSEEAGRILSHFQSAHNDFMRDLHLPGCTIGEYMEHMVWDHLSRASDLPTILDKIPKKPLLHSPADWKVLHERAMEAAKRLRIADIARDGGLRGGPYKNKEFEQYYKDYYEWQKEQEER